MIITVKSWCLWGTKSWHAYTQLISERRRTFDLEKALICSWRTLMFDQDYQVYHYMGLRGSCQLGILFFSLHIGIKSSVSVYFITWTVTVTFCEILKFLLFYLAGFPRKQIGKKLYFLIFYYKDICMFMDNHVVTHTYTPWFTYTELRKMRQVLLETGVL